MKLSLLITITLASSWPALAQTGAPVAGGNNATAPAAAPVIEDGIVFYNEQAYLIRNGRATRIDATLIPNGHLLTTDGRLVPVPMNYTGFQQGAGATQNQTNVLQVQPSNQQALPGSQTQQAAQGDTRILPGNARPPAAQPIAPGQRVPPGTQHIAPRDQQPATPAAEPIAPDTAPGQRSGTPPANASGATSGTRSSGSGTSGTTRGSGGSGNTFGGNKQ